MDLSKQVDLFNSINILPIKFRFLRNFIRFLNSNLSNLFQKHYYNGLYLKLQKKPFLLVLIFIDILSLKLNTINFLFLLFLSKFLIYFYLIKKPKKTQKIKFNAAIKDQNTLLNFYIIYSKSLESG
jgi:hypothetical protein